jgi:hypothetical protein
MTDYVVNTEVDNTTTILSNLGDSVLVTNTGSILYPSNIAIDSEAIEQQITVDGFVSANTGIYLSSASANVLINGEVQGLGGLGAIEARGTMENISVGSQGRVDNISTSAIFFNNTVNQTNPPTFDTVTNQGTINSASYAAIFTQVGGDDTFSNSGTISGATGIELTSNTGIETVENSGTIKGNGGAAISSSLLTISGTVIPGDGVHLINSSTGLLTNTGSNSFGENFAGVLSFADSAGSSSSINNAGTIIGDGYVIQSLSDALDITNSGTIQGGLDAQGGATISNSGLWQATTDSDLTIDGLGSSIANSGKISASIIFGTIGESLTNNLGGTITGALTFDGANDTVDNAGAIDGSVTLVAGGDQFTNAGSIDGAIAFTGAGGANTLTNSGSITGDVGLAASSVLKNSGSITGDVTLAASSVLKNHYQIYGDVTLGAGDALTNTGVIHGDVTLGAGDTINDSRGRVTGAFTASTNDLFAYTGHFGEETINSFATSSDVIQFAANDFGSFGQVMGSTRQVGLDTVIGLDATDSITLVGVAKSSLASTDFKFV